MGGNIFTGTQPIKKEHIAPTIKKYFEELSKVFPNKTNYFNELYFKAVGSVGKKPYSGDIDFAVDTNTITDGTISDPSLADWNLDHKQILEFYEIYKKRARTASNHSLSVRAIMTGIVLKINALSDSIHCDEKKIGAGGIFASFPQYDENENELGYNVQIDWMIGNMDWLEFSYYSESYEGNVKGLHRTQLILAMFNARGFSFSHTAGVSILKTKSTIARTPKEAISVLEKAYSCKIGNKINNFHLLLYIVKNFSQVDMLNVLDIYLKILDRTRCDIPEGFLQDYWTNNQERLGLTGKFLPIESKLVNINSQSVKADGLKGA